jgi:endo-1,4-beta-xylanase
MALIATIPTQLRSFVIAAACLWAFPVNAQSLITNGTFEEDVAPWWDHADEAKAAMQTVAVAEGRMCSTISAGGDETWDVILGISDLALVADQTYHIRFSASADVDREIRFKTGLGEAPYTDYFLKTIQLTATPSIFEYTYLNLKEDPAAQFQFHIGGSPGTVCVDDVVLEPVAAPVLPAYVTPSLTGHALRDHAAVVKMGTAVDTPAFLSSPSHNAIVAGEFSMMTPANSMKMNIIQPTQGVFDWVETDKLLEFAQQNSLEFHGHPLVWHTQAPAWLVDGTFDRDAMIQVMYSHIDALVGRYAGKMPYWDVVNEAIERDGDVYDFRHTIWYDRIGADFIDLAFQRAHAADPAALLLYNDYNIEVMGNAKADKVFDLISGMKARGIPIHQVGFQSHYYVTPDGGSSGIPNMENIRANMARYNDIGVGVQITECDFRVGKPLDGAKEQAQAKFFADLLQVCIDAPNCSHYTVWGLSDFDSWVPSTFPEYDYAHIFDANLAPKAAYHSLTQVFSAYNTDGTPLGGAEPPRAGSKSGGCGVHPVTARGGHGSLGAWVALGLAFGYRLASRRRA